MESLAKGNQIRAVTKMTKNLRKNTSVVNVHCIPNARVPIVKFAHAETSLSCDLSFKNRMAVLNTEFIRLCIESDSRIRSVMMTIRYWASRYDLSGEKIIHVAISRNFLILKFFS